MRLPPSFSPYLERMTEPGGDRAALVAVLRVRPDRLTWPEITTEVTKVHEVYSWPRAFEAICMSTPELSLGDMP